MNVSILFSALAVAMIGSAAHAQSVSSLHVGDDLAAAAAVVAKGGLEPIAQEDLGAYVAVKWRLPDSNEVSVTASRDTEKIVHVEANWGRDRNATFTDVPGLLFGTTTLNDIRRRFANNGFAYQNWRSTAQTDDGMIAMNSYEIADSHLVVTFITRMDPGALKGPKNIGTALKLDTIIVADADYLDTIWGKGKSFDRKYKKVHLDR
jgi:hypothetical protein